MRNPPNSLILARISDRLYCSFIFAGIVSKTSNPAFCVEPSLFKSKSLLFTFFNRPDARKLKLGRLPALLFAFFNRPDARKSKSGRLPALLFAFFNRPDAQKLKLGRLPTAIHQSVCNFIRKMIGKIAQTAYFVQIFARVKSKKLHVIFLQFIVDKTAPHD